MQELSLDKQILIALKEIYDKRRFCTISFLVISMLVVAVGLIWPKTYQSSTTILWNQSQVIQPLLEGTVVTSSGRKQAEIAKEVIYSNRNLDELIQQADLGITKSGRKMRDREIELLKSELRKKIIVERGSNDTLRISFKSADAEEAYIIVSVISKLFIEETTRNSKTDTVNAYNFIQNQVNDYQQKLNDINKSIIDFKTKNVEIQVDTTQGVNARISNLSEQIKATSLQLKEAFIRRDSLREQLLIESQKSTADEVAIVRNERLIELEGRLSTLRLSYTETYPDIIELKDQIRSLKLNLEQEANRRPEESEPSKSPVGAIVRSPLYDRLKQQVADQETVIRTLEARKIDQENRFGQEIARSSKVNFLVSRLEELARDRSVTKQLYDQLLAKLENARVSLNLEKESTSALFKVQEPPVIPLVPEGLRFLHFAIGSIVLGAAIPLGLIIGILLIDPRIRHEEALDLGNDIPVIGVIPCYKTTIELRKQKFVTIQSVLIVIVSLTLVVALSLSRFYEVI